MAKKTSLMDSDGVKNVTEMAQRALGTLFFGGRTLLLCTMVGAIGGGTIAYKLENNESKQFLEYLKRVDFEPVKMELRRSITDCESKKEKIHQKLIVAEERADELSKDLENSQRELSTCVSERADFELRNQKNESKLDSTEHAADSIQRELELSEKELGIRDNQIDSLEKELERFPKRYSMQTEFGMLIECIYGHRYSMTKDQVERQSKCCLDSIRKIQGKYPTEKALNKIREDFEFKQPSCAVNRYSGY